MNAIRTLKRVLDEGRYATPEEQAVMAKFVGWGGLPNVFKDESELSGMWLGAHRELKWLFNSRAEWGMSAWNDAMASTRNAHYTSEKVVRMMWDAVRHFGFEGGVALEPTVGVGNFISLQPKDLASATEWHATELDVVTGQLATMLFPNAHVIGGSGFEYAKFRNGVFDIVIGNPPFARDAVRTHAKGYEELKGLSLHNFIVGKSGKHLRPGGVMAMVITHHFLDAGDTRGRAQLAKDFKFLGAVRLPNTAFKANAGTEVTTDIIFLQKLHEGESPDMKAAWLDSSGKVTNKAGERVSVNRYFEEHPNHILGEPSMRGKMHAGEEHTVEDDGRDFVKAFGDILAGDFAELKGTLKPSKRDLDVSAVMAMQSDIPVGGMRLEPDGKIRMRTDDDVSGNSVIVDIVPGIPWGNNAEEWHGMARIARELKEGVSASDLPVKMKEFFAFAKEAGIYNKNDAFAAKTDVGKGIDRLYKAGTEAAGKGSSLEWEFDDILKKIETGRKTRTLSQNDYERLNGLLDLRNRMLALNLAELRDAANMEEIRSGLREAYNNFVETFGHVSSKANRAMIGEDVGAEAGIEIEYDAGVTESQSQKTGAPVREASAVVADILDRRVVHPYREIVSVDGADPALHASIRERGKVDLEYMSEISGKDRDELVAELASGEAPKIFLNPANNKYEDASEYLSGNVRKKLAEAEKHRMEANVKALRKVQPAPKTAAQVTPSLKGSWIPAGVFERFLSDLGLQNVNVYVSSATGKIVGMASDVVLKTEWGGMFNNPDFSILDFFNAATQGKMLKAYVGSGDNRTIDREATDRANMLVEMMSREFEKWARGDAGIMDKIVDAFNEKMNTHVEPKFNGRELLVTAGANPSVELRDTQKDAAWRMIRTDSVLLDHVVGAGKTYALITGAMERRRMGASKKPLFVVPNHLVGQWTRDFYKLYPGSRVLAASEKSMKPQNRKALFARIATGDFDAVIIGHSHLSFIENAAVDEKAIIDEQLSGLRAALEDAEETGNSRSVKQIQERIDKYKARLAELAEGKRDEIGYDFEKMGIDYLVVDEAHLFKNLEYSSGNPRIAGMNDPKGAAKSFDMYVKTRGLRKRGGGVAFATGTPVSNSLVEIYTMMKYLAYDELASRNLQHFDAWAGAYTITETRLEYTATQKLKPRRVLSSLVNLSSLQQIYKHFADTITLQNLKDAYRIQMERENESLPEGKKKRTEFPVPKIVENPDSGRNERKLDTGEPSEEQTEYFDYLTARMNAIESNARNSKYRRIDNPLWVLNDARIASLDIRTIDPTLPRNENGKVMRAARNIKRLYDQWDDVRGAQLVFCDDSVPSSGSKAKAKKMFKTFAEGVFGEGDAARIMKRLEGRPFIEQWRGLQSALENLLDSEDSRVKAAEDFLEKNEEKYADFRMTALARTADSGFSVYEDLRKVLSQEMGIPESEIQFIHDHNTAEKKAELFARVNSGNVRILIGSTDMMGAGMNAQERLVALHHLDAPWRPSDLEQREGRIIRQKNELYLADPDGFRIEIIAYSTEKTSDAVMWQTLERKARGIEQFRSGGEVDTLTEEGGNDADQFANFMANTTGNPVFLQKLKAERRYNELEASQSGLIRSKSSAERFMDSFDTEKEKLELAIKNAESASASVIKYGEHKGSGKEIDAVLDAATKAYWAEKEEYDAEYRVYREEWDRWRSAGADKNTEPKAPTSPVMPWLLSKSVVADSDGAKAIAKAFEDAKKLSSGDHVSIPVGNVEVRIVNYGAGSLSDKKRAEGLKEWGVAFHRNPKGKPDWRIVQTGVEARNLSDLVESVHPKFIERVYANLLVSAKKDLDRMIANRPAMEKMAAMDIDQSEANRALQELAWYQRQVSFAELDADIERADRKNRFIEADTFRRLSVKKRDSYGEDRTGDVVKDIDGEEYRLDGHNLGIYTRAFRMKDDVPVVLVSESKDGKTRYVVELEQPASLREGAEETLYQMGDTDAAQQMTPEESLKLVQAIRAGDLRSRHLGKVWEGEPPTGPLVRTVIPISEIPDVTIEYMRETSDPERVNRYAKDDIQTPIYLRVNQEGYLVVSDGGHRLLAAIQRGDSTINVLMPANYVRDGDRYVLKSEADLSSDADYLTQSVATEADLVKLRNAYPGYYQGEGAEAKGSITFRRGTDARPEIRLFENADASTFMHEAMHFFVDDLLRQMNTGKASDETKNLFRQLNNVVRVSKDKNKKFILAEKEHEKLAVGFEAYLERGVAPKGAKGLQGVFEKFKQWLKELFSFARSNNVEMSDALVSLYDTMLTTPEERAAAESELAESANVEESVETIEAAEVEADVNEGVETIEAEVMAEDETVDFASPEGEKELAGQPRAWEAPRPSMNPEARALGLRKIRDLVKRLVPWRFGNTEDRTGVYSEREKLIKTKDDYDFPTAMHEVGHHLMTELKLNTGLQKGILKELESLGKQTARPGAAQDVVLAEGVAQFVQYYIINKAAAKAAAPVFFVEFESRLDKADAKLVEDFGDLRDAVSAFYESSPESRVLAHVRSAGEKKPYSKTLVSSRLKRAIFKSYEGLVDDKHSWNLLTEWIKDTPEGKEEMKNNGGFLPDRLDFYAQVSTLAGYMKQADKDVEGMMNLVGKLTKKEYDQLTAYAVSLQSIEYYDNDMNPGTGPRTDHEAVVANTPQHIKDVLKGVQDIYNNMVKETLLDTGVISQEGFDAMRTKWENYVPFMRDLDEDGFIDWLTKGAPKNGANLRSYVDVRNPFMKRYGVAEHERTEIFDPFEVMIHNAVVFHGIKSRNDFAKLVVDAANSLDGFGWLASKSEAMSKADMKEHAVFYVWRDGQKEYYSTDPELYVLLKGMYDSGSKAGNPFIRGALSWMQFAADVFKMGTTRYNPAFMLLNFLRDAQGTAIQSEGWAMPFVATIKGLMLQLSNDPKHKQLIEDAINDGVFYSAITSLPKGTSIEAIAKELRRQRRLASSTGIARTLRNLMETPRSVGGWIGRANEMVEMAPKLYEYEYLRRTKPQMGRKRAAMKARSVNIDFGRAGTWGRGFNSVTAFFNAGVQGLDKVREVSKQRPMQTFAKVMLYQVLPSVLMRLAILSNPDDEEKYQRIAPGMRDTHFFIPVQNETLGMNVWTRLPKADNWWIISAVFERMITEAAKKDPEAWRGFANSVVNLLPPYVPTMIAPIIQVWKGKDSFTDRPIVSKRYEHLPDELQFHTGTSETAKLLGKVTKTSPIILEFMYDKHVGEVGAQVLSLAEWTFDMIGTGMGLVDEKTKMEAGKASDLPFFKRFFYDTTRTGEPLNRFYSYHDQLLDDKKRADAAGTIFEDERLLKAFNRTRAKFTEINREKDDIRLDPDLSRKDKRELIDMLENRAAEYAKAAMAVYYEEKGIK